MHVFISYAKADTRPLALNIRDQLTALPDVTAWIDESLEAGSSWAAQIGEEIDRCDYVVVLLSPDVNRPATLSQARSFVLNEIDYAQQINKTIIPVMAQATRVPVQLAGIQYIGLTSDENASIQRLIRRITEGSDDVQPPIPPVPSAGAASRPFPVRWVVGGLLMLVVVIGGLLMVINSGVGPFPGRRPTPDFFTQAAMLLTEQAVTRTPDLNPTEIIATNMANIIATEAAKVASPRPLPTDTPTSIPSITPSPTDDLASTTTAEAVHQLETAQAIENMALALTQMAQLTANAPTNTPLPTRTATATATPTSTATVTDTATPTSTITPTLAPNLTQTAQAQLVQETVIFNAALATATVQAQEVNRIRKAVFNITAAFEGNGYSTYQNFDAGIVSYGRFLFTLAGGGLYNVLEKYTSNSESDIANELTGYLERVQNRDANLRNDERFKELLIVAGDDPVMQATQDEVATQSLWDVVQELSIIPRGIQTPLGQALLFDMAINFGPNHGFIRLAEDNLGVAFQSRVGDENGISEEALITEVARVRKQAHDRQAERDNLPGLKARGDFWVNLIEQGDWQLQGDADGNVEVKPGRIVQVRNP